MILEYDIQRLEKKINDFYNATGVSVSVLNDGYSVLCSKKNNNPYCRSIQSKSCCMSECIDFSCNILAECKKSKRPCIRVCHAGLMEMAVPIICHEEIIGFIMLGHVRTDMPFSAILGKIEEYRFDVSKTQTLYDSLPVFDSQKIDGIMGVVDMLVTCLVSENILYTKHNESYEAVRKYIYNNYDKKLTARDIAHNVHMSKTTLYKTVKTFTGYSINEFLNLVRIEKSKELLVGTDIPIENIAKKLGFSSITYYTRLFKKAVGVPPSVYRKNGKYELKDFSVRKERLNDDK